MLTPGDVFALEKSVAEESLIDFSEMAWPHVQNRPLSINWHMEAICDHLSAVSGGEIRRLIINVPPRHTKSLLCNVFWPSWDWIANSWRQFLFVSYKVGLSKRDNRHARRLIGSDWYQQRWDTPIDQSQDASDRWRISAGGERLVGSVGAASSTGEGGDIIIVDDPISADAARSEKERNNVIEWWDETIKSRLNDQRKGAIVIVMQRLHEEDLTGHVMASETGWDHLVLPARYEPDHPFPIKSSIGFKDPRKKDGDLLNPDRFGEKELNEIAKPGSYADAGQLQQRPSPKGGGMFHRDWFIPVRAAPQCVRYVRGWDLAASDKKDSAYTAGVLVGLTEDKEYVIIDVVRGQLTDAGVKKLIKTTSTHDKFNYGGKVLSSIPQDPGAGGKVWARDIIKHCAGLDVRKSTESGDKVTRAAPVSAQAEADNVSIVLGDWNKPYLDELALFPNGKFKDQVDATSRAFMDLATEKFQWYVGEGADE